MIAAHLDFETYSTCDLRAAGAHAYAEDPSTGVWCMAWCVGDAPVMTWKPGEPDPEDLLAFIRDGGKIVIHNAQFDRQIWNKVVRRDRPHWPEIQIGQTICTMARAQAMALPASLDQLGYALGLKIQKDKDGAALMMRMCRPRKVGLTQEECPACHGKGIWRDEHERTWDCTTCSGDGFIVNPNGVVWWDEPEKIDRLTDYCRIDVEAERLADEALPFLPAAEQEVYELDQLINERGVMIDLQIVRKAVAVVKEAKRRADERMWYLTDGEVQKTTETAKLVAWINSKGVPCESVAKGETEELILRATVTDNPVVEEVVRLRKAAAKSSAAKFTAMEKSACVDGRVRGTLAYHGAATGRWAGRLIQPQNLPRVDPDRDLPDVERALTLLGLDMRPAEIVDALEMLTGQPMETLSKCLRAMLIAGPGKKFVGGDFSNIEGRVNAWLAGEDWKVQAFRDFDAGAGNDLYKLAYARSFGVKVEDVSKADRQIGKVMELALGYQGGVGAFQTMASGYGIKVTDERADELKRAWREAHPRIVQSWWDLSDAAIAAVGSPGEITQVLEGRIRYRASNGFLFCRLPSGRCLAYAKPRLVQVEDLRGRMRYQIEYDAVDSVTRRWGPSRLYGGLQCENVVQAIARDVMVASMLQAEDAGLPVVLTVHDELLCETGPEGDAEVLRKIMATVPEWAEGLPIAAATWEDKRYVK